MKNIVYKVTWKNMMMNKRRTWTAFFGIFFMVLLITCVFVGSETAVDYLQNVSTQMKGKWHFSVYDVTDKELAELMKLDYIETAGCSADKGYTEFGGSANPESPYLFVKSYEEPFFDWMNVDVKDGRLPENPQEIVVSQKALDEGAKIKIGDTVEAEYFGRTVTGIEEGVETTFPFQQLTIRYGETKELPQDFPFYEENNSFRIDKEYTGVKEELTVVGIVDSPWFEQEGAAGYLAFSGYDEKAAGGTFNAAGLFDLDTEADDMYQEIRDIAGDKKVEFNDYVLSFSGKSSDSVVNFMVRVMTVFFLVLIAAAAVILIYNVFNLSFEERSRYLGMLCSVGATGKQKRSSVYFEAFSLFLPALPLGITGGCLVVLLGMRLLMPFIQTSMSVNWAVIPEQIPVVLQISVKEILFIALSSGITVFLSALLPAAKISRTGPIECIRGNLNQGGGKRRKPLKGSLDMKAEKMLAKNSMRNQKRKTRGMNRAAAVFMIILIVTASSAQMLTKLITYRMIDSEGINSETDGWDYQLAVFNGVPGDTYKELKEEIVNDESVEAVQEMYTGMFIGNIPHETLGREYWDALHRVFDLYHHRKLSDEEFDEYFGEGTSVMNLIAVDDETFRKIAEVTDTDMDLLDSDRAAIVVQSGEVSTENWSVGGMEPEKFEFHEISHMTDLEKGDSLPMTVYSPEKEKQVDFPLCVAGYASNEELKDYFTFHSEILWAIVDDRTAEEINSIAAPPGAEEEMSSGMEPNLYLRLNEKDTGLVKRLSALTEADDIHYAFAEAGAVKTLADALCSMIRILLVCFVLLTSVICLLNLYNSIGGWIAEQKSHFAMLMSVGATKGQIRRMLFYEACSMLARSCIWMGVITVPLFLGLRRLLTERFGHVTIAFPWWLYVAAIFITAIVILGFMMYHYQREKNNYSSLVKEIYMQ